MAKGYQARFGNANKASLIAAKPFYDPLITYESPYAGFLWARFLQRDARGSIVYSSDHNNSAAVANAYEGSDDLQLEVKVWRAGSV